MSLIVLTGSHSAHPFWTVLTPCRETLGRLQVGEESRAEKDGEMGVVLQNYHKPCPVVD